jgi:hypothetical protein
VVNLSFSFRTPSTSSYLLVGVNEREDRRLPTVETRTRGLVVVFSLTTVDRCRCALSKHSDSQLSSVSKKNVAKQDMEDESSLDRL